MPLKAKPAATALIAIGILLVAGRAFSAAPAAGVAISKNGVNVWVPQKKFQGDFAVLQRTDWQTLSADARPRSFRGEPVIAAASVLGTFDSQKGCVVLYTRTGDHLEKRAIVQPYPGQRAVDYRLRNDDEKARLGIEVLSGRNRLEYTLYLDKDGIIEFKPARVQGLTIAESGMKYGIVPSFIGTDFVYDPRQYTGKDRLYIPSMNLYTGLVRGGNCMMVGVWPPGEQVVSLNLKEISGERIIDGLSLEFAKKSFYLTLLEHPDLWHAEALKDTYLETDTAIGWKRPFPALWIGRFFIESEGIHFPFYFQSEKTKIWGRCIRGWFGYPFWFDGDKTFVHFEKKFPPKGEMLIYFLEREKEAGEIGSPVEVMQKALGAPLAAKFLDFDGIELRPLLEHHNAVCAMSDKLQTIFDGGNEMKEKKQVAQYAADIAAFIRMIRERIFEYADFAREMKEFLSTRTQAAPDLAAPLQGIRQTLDEMLQLRENDMPTASLDDVREWTDQIKKLANEVRPENGKQIKVLTMDCRKVAGAQDDLDRALSILTIRLTEEAAEFGIESPKRVKVAEAIIARARQVLRCPTWWEPYRCHSPKPNPGAP